MSNEKKRGLGRGIGSLFGGADIDFSKDEQPVVKKEETSVKKAAVRIPSAAPTDDKERLDAIYVPIDDVSPNPNQPRKTFDPESIKDLSESIKAQGIIQPLLVEEIIPGRYSIIAGERRFRAAKEAGLQKIPVIIRKLSELERLQMSLIENIQREDLNPIEEASAYQYLIQRSGMTQEEVSEKVGKSRSAIANSLRLLSLNDTVKDDLISGAMTPGHARAILSLVNPSDQMLLRERIINDELSVREAERLAEEYNKGHKFVSRRKTKAEDPDVEEVVEKFVSAVGAKCEIRGSLSKGKLLIRFRNQQDLERLYGLMSGGDELFTE